MARLKNGELIQPRNVRNFWIELVVDGRSSKIATGPEGKEGGFALRVYQRGAPGDFSRPVLTVYGVEADGSLILDAHTTDGAGMILPDPKIRIQTERGGRT